MRIQWQKKLISTVTISHNCSKPVKFGKGIFKEDFFWEKVLSIHYSGYRNYPLHRKISCLHKKKILSPHKYTLDII